MLQIKRAGRSYSIFLGFKIISGMPPAFRNIVQWDDVRIRNWAASIGSSTLQVINRIFGTVNIKEQAYNPCLAVLRLGKNYSDERLEMACKLAIFRGISVPR